MAKGKSGKYEKKGFSAKDIAIITILVLINIAIIIYGKFRDKNYAAEYNGSTSTTNSKVEATEKKEEKPATESVKENEPNKVLNKEVKNKEVVFPRNSYIENTLNKGKFKGIIFGDSIAQGIGASKANILGDEIASGIFNNINMLTKEAMISDNYSVGGSTIETMLAYIADNKSGKSKAYEYPYWILITGRNEMDAMTVDEFKSLYKIAVSQGERNGIDVICVTEPPEIDMSTGELVESKYSQYQKVIKEVAAEEGATFIDVYNGLLKKRSSGESISKLSSNGVLPNNEGYKFMAGLITEGIVGKNDSEFKKADSKSEVKLMAQYEVEKKVDKLKIQNLATKSTAKEFNTGAGEIISLESGAELSFTIPEGQPVGAIVTLVTNFNNGSVEVKTKDEEISKVLKPLSGTAKEVSYFIPLEKLKNSKELLVVSRGETHLSGVVFITK